jgi:hypothetical protein
MPDLYFLTVVKMRLFPSEKSISGRHIGKIDTGIRKKLMHLVAQSYSGKVTKPHLIISNGSGDIARKLAWG